METFSLMMDRFENILTFLAAPFVIPFMPGQRIYVGYLISAVVLAFVVYHVSHRSTRGNPLSNFVKFCFDRRILFHKSAIVDYKYFVVNKIFYTIFLAPLVLSSAIFSGLTIDILNYAWQIDQVLLTPGLTATVALTVLSIVLLDLGTFIAHYLQHKVPALWEFHKVHHSAEVLTPITVYRMHPVDDLLAGSIGGMTVGIGHGVFEFMYAGLPSTISVVELNVFLFLFYLLGYNLRHSHIWLSYPRKLSHILISPAQHQIHHSKAPQHFDKNLGFIFAFWDYFCGTLYVPNAREDLEFGLEGDEEKDYDSVMRLYFLPIRKLAGHFRRARKAYR